MGQTHILEGLRIGEKDRRNLLARQIVSIDFKLLQHAIQSIGRPSNSFPESVSANSATYLKNSVRISQDYLINCASEAKDEANYLLHQEGLQLLSKSKAAIVLIINDKDHNGEVSETDGRVLKSSVSQFENLLLGCKRFWKVKEQGSAVPLIVVSPAHLIRPYQEFLSENDHFGIDLKVWFLEELQLPIVSMPIDQSGSKILLKSSWEILQAPIGSGGFLMSLLSNNIMTELNKIGVEYVQVCSLNDRTTIGHPLFFGLVSLRRADVGIKIFENTAEEDEFDMIFSMRHLNKMTRQIDKFQFRPVPEHYLHVKQENEFVTAYPGAPNSYSFHCSIYSSLNTCSLDSLCAMKVFE
ncbi:hypothetical protein Cni_G23289 [Canna indica]|uniref:Uncharacterized protein n=1 Tax=Canna indica TaxID=4628 RepID=A0AAQ3KTR3_9LILI|nr:hypothetical protein Cni_G23289 [Canna indica]